MSAWVENENQRPLFILSFNEVLLKDILEEAAVEETFSKGNRGHFILDY